jgi:hypothetical protein
LCSPKTNRMLQRRKAYLPPPLACGGFGCVYGAGSLIRALQAQDSDVKAYVISCDHDRGMHSQCASLRNALDGYAIKTFKKESNLWEEVRCGLLVYGVLKRRNLQGLIPYPMDAFSTACIAKEPIAGYVQDREDVLLMRRFEEDLTSLAPRVLQQPAPYLSALLHNVLSTYLLVCDALHAESYAYMDGKWDNMLHNGTSEFVVCDFGLVIHSRDIRGVCGTPLFVSPMLDRVFDQELQGMKRDRWALVGAAKEYDLFYGVRSWDKAQMLYRFMDFHAIGNAILEWYVSGGKSPVLGAAAVAFLKTDQFKDTASSVYRRLCKAVGLAPMHQVQEQFVDRGGFKIAYVEDRPPVKEAVVVGGSGVRVKIVTRKVAAGPNVDRTGEALKHHVERLRQVQNVVPVQDRAEVAAPARTRARVPGPIPQAPARTQVDAIKPSTDPYRDYFAPVRA